MDSGWDRSGNGEVKPCRIGFVGTGGVAHRHARVLGRVRRRRAGRRHRHRPHPRRGVRRRARRAAPSPTSTRCWTQELDAVYVCVPPYAHGPTEVRIAAAGVALFVEKPLAIDQPTAEWVGPPDQHVRCPHAGRPPLAVRRAGAPSPEAARRQTRPARHRRVAGLARRRWRGGRTAPAPAARSSSRPCTCWTWRASSSARSPRCTPPRAGRCPAAPRPPPARAAVLRERRRRHVRHHVRPGRQAPHRAGDRGRRDRRRGRRGLARRARRRGRRTAPSTTRWRRAPPWTQRSSPRCAARPCRPSRTAPDHAEALRSHRLACALARSAGSGHAELVR